MKNAIILVVAVLLSVSLVTIAQNQSGVSTKSTRPNTTYKTVPIATGGTAEAVASKIENALNNQAKDGFYLNQTLKAPVVNGKGLGEEVLFLVFVKSEL